MKLFLGVAIIATIFSSTIQAQTLNQVQSLSTEQMATLTLKAKEKGLTKQELYEQVKKNNIRTYEQAIAFLDNSDNFLEKETQVVIKAPTKKVSNASKTEPDLDKIIEKEESKLAKKQGSNKTPYFGYAIFKTTPDAFKPNATGAVDPNYVITTDDVIKVTIWGAVDLTNELKVDKTGRIYLEKTGPVAIIGLTTKQAQQKLKSLFGKHFSGLNGSQPDTWIDVSVTDMKPKRVFIMGEVNNPGGYTVSSSSTVFNSLFSVGGPTIEGSLREVKVIRNNRTVATVDLYDFLTGSSKTSDINLQNNDIIFVPPRISTIKIEGEVRKEFIFELKKGETISDLIKFAGGLKTTASTQRAVVHRVKPLLEREEGEENRIVIDIDIQQEIKNKKSTFKLHDLDVVKVFKISDEFHNFVTVNGAVLNPGRIAFSSGMTLKNAIEQSGNIIPTTFLEKAEIIRQNADSSYGRKIKTAFNHSSNFSNKNTFTPCCIKWINNFDICIRIIF